jgi:4,5-DOPA dioxygenase extradiol
MERKDFLKYLTVLPFAGAAMKLKDLNAMTGSFGPTEKMPLLFLGHGNPMNAITDNEFTRGWQQVGKSFPKPNAVLCISAHWETNGTFVTAMEKPKTIHDFGGFPQELYEVQYPAPGNPQLAGETKHVITKTPVALDHEWGLDHGCWSVIKHLFPKADVPVIQLSLDRSKPAQWHYELAKELSSLRNKGVLIVGSGNVVHNLGMANWDEAGGFDWAVEANDRIKKLVEANNHQPLINYTAMGREMKLAVPTPEHYLPLLYVLGLKEERENVSFFNDKTELGSISMTSVKIA